MSAPAPPLPSIAARLARQLLLISMGWALAAGLLVFVVVQEEADELLDETLEASAEVLGQLLKDTGGSTGVVPHVNPSITHFAWQLQGPDGTLLSRSSHAPSQPWRLPPGFSDWRADAPAVRADGPTWTATSREITASASAPPVAASSSPADTPAVRAHGPTGGTFGHETRAPGSAPSVATSSSPAAASTSAEDGRRTKAAPTDRDDWRVYVTPLQTAVGPGWLMVAQTTDERREVRRRVGVASALSALVVGVIGLAWMRRRARRELAPLGRLSAALADYDPLHPGDDLPAQSRSELADIRAAMLELGQRLAQRVANERAFSAHAAHALRTPLAGMDAQLAMALREAPPEQRQRLQRTREAADRLRRVVTALLTLFRSGMSLQWQRLDLAELLAHLPLPQQLALDLPEPAWVDADPDLLAAALINLLDNAWRHRATRLRITLTPQPAGGLDLLLEDDGNGTPEPQRAALDQALQDQLYEGRMGLGLMMADLVARAHGGGLRLPPAARGFAVLLRLGAPPPA